MVVKKYKSPFMIAEIGINHNGDIKKAFKLIDLAKKYQFDAVKFQKRNPDISTPEYQKSQMRETPWGYISYLNYKKKIELSYKDYLKIDKYCKKKKILWFASAWDVESQKFLKKFNLKYNKVASAMLTNIKLLNIIAKEKKHTFISTGMSSLKEIKSAISIFKKNKCKFTILHCISSYPSKEEDLNLLCIPKLKKIFKSDIGYSGHEDSVSPSIIASLLGAVVIERHITLDRSMWGTDQAASLSEDGIKYLMSVIKKIPKMLGNGKKKFSFEEKKLLNKFKYW